MTPMCVWVVGCGGSGGTMPFDTIDARRTALCKSSEPTCTDQVITCEHG